MPLIAYIQKRFNSKSRWMIDTANQILAEYARDGYDLTLRQLYYQFVARDLIPNNAQSYKRLGQCINDARMAGEIDWGHIVDRTRPVYAITHFESPADAVQRAAESYARDLWEAQPYYIEVWVEKDALMGIIARTCDAYDIPYCSCRGFTSQSAGWRAAMRLRHRVAEGKKPVILHFADHDPSGVDMTRDIIDRMKVFGLEMDLVQRVALTMKQVKKYKPPPNFAKTTDSRTPKYKKKYGNKCWELDALDPKTLDALIRNEIDKRLDIKAWKKETKRAERERAELIRAAENWPGGIQKSHWVYSGKKRLGQEFLINGDWYFIFYDQRKNPKGLRCGRFMPDRSKGEKFTYKEE